MNIITNARKRKKLTLDMVAKQLNTSKSNYCNIEKGRRKISLEAGIILSKLLDLDIQQIKNFNLKVHKMKTKQEQKISQKTA